MECSSAAGKAEGLREQEAETHIASARRRAREVVFSVEAT